MEIILCGLQAKHTIFYRYSSVHAGRIGVDLSTGCQQQNNECTTSTRLYITSQLLSKIVQSAILFNLGYYYFTQMFHYVNLRRVCMIENKSPWAFALLLGGRNEYFSCSFFGRDYFQMRHKVKHNTRHNRTGIFHKSAYQENTRLAASTALARQQAAPYD